jgi:hypothetical protein
MDTNELYILWTNADEITFDKMVAMYSRNAILKGWWKKVTIIIWGATARLTAQSELVQYKLKECRHVGVHITACIACATELGVVKELEAQDIELKPWGEPLTTLIKSDAKILSV